MEIGLGFDPEIPVSSILTALATVDQ
jgi:hypothetical protein